VQSSEEQLLIDHRRNARRRNEILRERGIIEGKQPRLLGAVKDDANPDAGELAINEAIETVFGEPNEEANARAERVAGIASSTIPQSCWASYGSDH
jgi:hypothetical protein